MKKIFLILFLIINVSYLNAQTYISPGVFSDNLIDILIDEYKTSSTLGYNTARDTMYLIIDNDEGSVSGVYSNFSVDLIPGTCATQGQIFPITDAFNWETDFAHNKTKSVLGFCIQFSCHSNSC